MSFILNISTNKSKITFVIVIAVIIEAITPIVRVIANPFTEPVPKTKSIIVIIRVVTLESTIEENPFLNPRFIPPIIVFPHEFLPLSFQK